MQAILAENAETKRLICRCPVKGCGFVKAFDVPTVERVIRTRWNTFLTREASPGAVLSLANDERCPAHPNHLVRARIVKGEFSADRVCDSRCTSAIGHNCECQCGGANHGAHHL